VGNGFLSSSYTFPVYVPWPSHCNVEELECTKEGLIRLRSPRLDDASH
jgi:hypothetical protein